MEALPGTDSGNPHLPEITCKSGRLLARKGNVTFKDRTILVTGGGTGIGRATALAFARQGGNVVVAGRTEAKLTAVAAELRALDTHPMAVRTDVSVESEVRAMVAAARAKYGRLDVLVNNAGIIGPVGLARDIPAKDWGETLAINLTGAFLCAKGVCPAMMEAGRGAIINISSVVGRMGYGLASAYATSKWALIGLSHSLAAELGPYGIRVNAVLPGPTEGERVKRVIAARAMAEGISREAAREWYVKDVPLGRMVSEAEVAGTVVFLASEAASAITGQAFEVCGGFRMQ